MSYKNKCIVILLLPILFFSSIFVWDPVGIYRRSYLIVNRNDMRKYAVAAIDDKYFDSYIIGTSILKNSSAREAEAYMPNRHFANISMNGAEYNEREVVLKYIFKHKKPKEIIYSLDLYYISALRNQTDKFAFRYDDTKLNDFSLYFTKSLYKSLLKYYREKHGKDKNTIGYNCPDTWGDSCVFMSRFGGYKNWALCALKDVLKEIEKGKQDSQKQLKKQEISTAIKNSEVYLEESIIRYVRQNPQTEFHLVFPPYSRIMYAIWHQYNLKNAAIHEAVVRYCVKQASLLSNLHIYGFEDMDLSDDISSYMDYVHYHPDINSFITKSIAKREHEITTENIEQYLQMAKQKALAFDLVTLSNDLKKMLKESKN